jgi:hypothetical protein
MAQRSGDIRTDLKAAERLSDYEAAEVLWVALVKAATRMSGGSEHGRMLELVSRMPVARVREVLHLPGVESLLNLDPPIETVLSDPHERLYPEDTRRAIDRIGEQRDSNPAEALVSLGEILKRIRNKRAHGFKTRRGPRDREILGAARQILLRLCELAVEVVDSDDDFGARVRR